MKKLEKLNRPIASKEIESVNKSSPPQKRSGPGGLTGECYQTFKYLIPILLKFFQKTEEEGTF